MGTPAPGTEEQRRYPLGRFQGRPESSTAERQALIEAIRTFPEELRGVLSSLPADALDRPVRPGAWSARQLVHHLADSHLNAITRFRLALTEHHPTIRPYDQEAWSRLADCMGDPPDASVSILEGVHARWSSLLASLPRGAFRRTLQHPESGVMTLDLLLQHYAWHGRHHLAQIRAVLPPEHAPLSAHS